MITEKTRSNFSRTLGEIQTQLMWMGFGLGTMTILTEWDIVQNIFKPDFIKALGVLRAIMGFISIILVGLNGAKVLFGSVKKISYKGIDIEFNKPKEVSENEDG